jgi:hypothetical protein
MDFRGRPEVWVLTDEVGWGTPYRRRVYSPLEDEPALFRVFAGLDPADRDAIAAFANQYGGLGKRRVLLAGWEEGKPTFPDGTQGETYEDWGWAIFYMRWAVRIWDMISTRDAAGLAKNITYHEKETRPGYPAREAGWSFNSHPDTPIRDVPAPGSVSSAIEPVVGLTEDTKIALMPATLLVQRWVNENLRDNSSPALVYHLKPGKQMLQIVPKNLLGAMWFQLAQAIAGNKNYRTCRDCGRWFEISGDTDGRTERRQFCDDACKSRDYRRRKERAVELRAGGKAPKAIASELGTDVETIKKWTVKKKG